MIRYKRGTTFLRSSYIVSSSRCLRDSLLLRAGEPHPHNPPLQLSHITSESTTICPAVETVAGVMGFNAQYEKADPFTKSQKQLVQLQGYIFDGCVGLSGASIPPRTMTQPPPSPSFLPSFPFSSPVPFPPPFHFSPFPFPLPFPSLRSRTP